MENLCFFFFPHQVFKNVLFDRSYLHLRIFNEVAQTFLKRIFDNVFVLRYNASNGYFYLLPPVSKCLSQQQQTKKLKTNNKVIQAT